MSERIFLDIGGGDGKWAIQQAQNNPDAKYVVIDPRASDSGCVLPENVTLLQRCAGICTPSLPFPPESVREAHLHQLMGQLRTPADPTPINEPSVAVELYQAVVKQVLEVLAPGGQLVVTDVQEYMSLVDSALCSCGLTPTEPVRVNDEKLTTFVEDHFSVFHQGGKPEAESSILPMEMVAFKKS